MPSLSALGEFKDSFDNIANEKEDLISRNLPFESFKLPTTEASEAEISRAALLASDNSDDSAVPFEATPESVPEEADSGVGAFDFSAFLGTLPADVNPPPLDDPPSIDDAFAGLTDPPSIDDAFAGLTDPPSVDDAFAGIDFPETAADEAQSGEAQSGEDMFGDLGLTDDASAGEDTDADLGLSADAGIDDLGLPTDTGIDDLGLSADAGTDAGEAAQADDFSVPDDLLSGLTEDIESAPTDFPSDDPGTEDFPSDEGFGEDSQMPDFPAEDFPSDEVPAAPEEFATEASDDLPSFDMPDGEQPDTEQFESEMPSFDEFDDAMDLGGERRDGSFSAESSDIAEPLDLGDSGDSGGDGASPDLDLGDFASEDMGGDSPPEEPPTADAGFGDLDLGEGFPLDASSGESADDFGLGEESIDMGGEDANGSFSTAEESIDMGGEDAGGNLKLDDAFADLESNFPSTGSDSAGLDDDFGSEPGLDNLGMDAQDSSGLDIDNLNVEVEDSGASMDFGDLGSDFASDSIDIDSEDTGTSAQADVPLGPVDFELPGLEDMFDKRKIDSIIPPPPKPKKGLLSRRKKAEIEDAPEPDDVDEIKLSQDDLDRLLATLASFPLNLRVACEELIAEQVLEPQQLSKLLRYLINGVSAKETAEFASQLLKKQIIIPRSFEKSSGAALEAEKASFAYIFVHNFLPIVRLFLVIAALAASTAFLIYKFIYTPLKAESLYKRGYERIFAGEYQRANELFHEAFTTHRKKKWFYEYARGFRDERRYMLAEAKYDELLRYYPRDKRGVLEYAHLETYYLLNYDKANQILQRQLLDYGPDDYDGLLASGDNFLAWADSNPEEFYDKYDDARFAYARLLQKYGWKAPLVERMMTYFIRTDNLKEVLPLRYWFDGAKDRKLSPESLAELGGYLLDKQISLAKGEIKGVPDPYIESIESVRAMLLQAVRENPELPEPHYHLARYYNIHGNSYEERLTLENAVRAFDLAKTETVRRRKYRVDTHYRYANLLINLKESFVAEEQVVRGIELYEDFLSRNLLPSSSQLGQLYSLRGDLDYFIKAVRTGDRQYVESALDYYRRAEQHKWSPPEIQYRIGSAYYQLEDWKNALDYLFKASSSLPMNRRLLYALGNTAYRRGNYYAAQGYYDRLLDVLENQRVRLPVLLPNDGPEFLELGERLMMARNNAGVVYEALAEQTGRRDYRSKALTLYAESSRAWDSITRNPQSMERRRIIELPGAPGVNPGFSNANNAMKPVSNYDPQIFPRIDKDVLEPSKWEEIAPTGGLQN